MRVAPIQILGALRKRLSDRHQTDNYAVENRYVDNYPDRQVDQDSIRETMIEAHLLIRPFIDRQSAE